jgi:hypothetical protein
MMKGKARKAIKKEIIVFNRHDKGCRLDDDSDADAVERS